MRKLNYCGGIMYLVIYILIVTNLWFVIVNFNNTLCKFQNIE
jgi:hypothetical protein